jgi:hypothetical protein
VGGVAGIYFFAYLSGKLIAWWNRNFRKPSRNTPEKEKKTKKTFTKRNRRIVRIKKQYGLIGIALATPFLLSIPVGVFLVVRYYRSSRVKFFYLIASNVIWSFIYAAFYIFWEGIIFKKA